MNARALMIARSMGLIGVTSALVLGATFALGNTNTVSLTGTTLAVTATTDNLRIFNFTTPTTGTFATSTTNPGGSGPIALTLALGVESPKQHFYLQNNGGTDLGISATATGTPAGGLDPTKVLVKFYDDAATPHLLGSATLASLQTTAAALDTTQGKLPAGTQGNSTALGADHDGNYLATFTLTSAASAVNLSGVDLQFTGTEL